MTGRWSRIQVNQVLAHFIGRACSVGPALSQKAILWGLLERARRIYAGAYAQQGHIAAEATAHLGELMIARSVCRALGRGRASEKRNSDHAMKFISRLDPFSAGGVRSQSPVGLYPIAKPPPAGAI